MRWQLATWLGKHETPEGEHRISVVRYVDDDEVDRIREAIRVVHAYIVREPFVLIVQNQMEYQSYEDYVRSRARDDPLPLLQADAQELGSGLRFRFLNWLLSFRRSSTSRRLISTGGSEGRKGAKVTRRSTRRSTDPTATR